MAVERHHHHRILHRTRKYQTRQSLSRKAEVEEVPRQRSIGRRRPPSSSSLAVHLEIRLGMGRRTYHQDNRLRSNILPPKSRLGRRVPCNFEWLVMDWVPVAVLERGKQVSLVLM